LQVQFDLLLSPHCVPSRFVIRNHDYQPSPL
jgi:hypothetical protein